ncbi:TetR/AcrR family transcriptional regulator [Streptomyces shenzhenensis]|uniref:TetR/AcrR family transcriptional regulator n=1 Tax=Streptomyces shenzhenensis TaxID=943815 RepID=UPI003D9385FA
MKRALDRSAVVQAALDTLRETGNLSLRDVAARLGVRTPSLYHHVEGREHLQRLVIEQLHDEIATRVDTGSSWQDALRLVARTQREKLAAYPTLIVTIAQEPAQSDSALTALENLTTVLLNAGFTGSQIRSIVGAVDLLVIGASVDATAPEDIYPTSVLEGQGRLQEVFGIRLGERRDPVLLFEFALEQLIGSFAALLGKPPHPLKTRASAPALTDRPLQPHSRRRGWTGTALPPCCCHRFLVRRLAWCDVPSCRLASRHDPRGLAVDGRAFARADPHRAAPRPD